VQLAKIQPLVCCWTTDYDWPKAEARLNALPQFITEIDQLDIQFAHIRSAHPDVQPRSWPNGGRAEDAFHLVLPSYPGDGLSGKPQGAGWGPDRVARAWDVLMGRLGYSKLAERNFHDLIDWNEVDKVGHFAACEQPELFTSEIWAAFRSAR
jgi:Epoxide hydrolase N terminus